MRTNRPAKTFLLLVITIVCGIVVMNLITSPSVFGGSARELDTYSLNDAIKNHQIISAEWQRTTLSGVLKPEGRFTARVADVSGPSAGEFEKFLRDNNVPYRIMDPPATTTIVGVLGVVAFPLLLIVLIYFLVLRPVQMGATSGFRSPNSGSWAAAQRAAPFSNVAPYLEVDDPDAFLAFATRAFGATSADRRLRPDGSVMRLDLRIGDSIVMVAANSLARDTQKSALHVWVDNVDERHNRAIEAGAMPLYPPRDDGEGHRLSAVIDPFGITWWIETRSI